jgi:hypothetical protein
LCSYWFAVKRPLPMYELTKWRAVWPVLWPV